MMKNIHDIDRGNRWNSWAMSSVLILVLSPLFALGQSSDYVFNVTPEDELFLRYNVVVNQFDTAYAGYEVGEIALGSGSTWNRVNWKYIPDGTKTEGVTTTGQDMSIAAVMQSETFEYDDEDTVQFYRMAYVYNEGCDPDVGPGSGGNGDGSGSGGAWTENDWWSTITGAIKDRQEFILEVVEESSGDVKLIVDSVRIDSNATSSVVSHTGDNPHLLLHKVEITGLTDGVDYFFRIRPKRYGNTAYGMMCGQHGIWISKSYIYERSGEGLHRLTTTVVDSIHGIYEDSALAYIDDEYNSTGRVPSTWSLYLDDETMDTIVARYYDSVQISGNWVLVEKPLPSPKATAGRRDVQLRVHEYPPLTFESNVFPNPSSVTGGLTIAFTHVSFPSVVTLRFVDVTGRTVKQFTKRLDGSPGTQNIPVAIDASGTYYLIIYDRVGRLLTNHNLIVID